jgi:hypothetical protein
MRRRFRCRKWCWADLENRIKELGEPLGMKRLGGRNFWGTEALHHLVHLVLAAYHLCVLL